LPSGGRFFIIYKIENKILPTRFNNIYNLLYLHN